MGLAILPARVRKPRDKAKVEGYVLIVERWILGRLRNRTLFTLGDLNAAISILMERLNARPFRKIDGNRRSRFEQLERAAMRVLPLRRYEFGEWGKCKVHPDYHIEVARAYYWVPYRYISERVDVRLTAQGLEIFHSGTLIAAHPSATERGRRSTRRAHRPERHISVIENTLSHTLERAAAVGPAAVAVLREQAARCEHPVESLCSVQGILRLGQDFTPAVLERALALRAYSYRAVRTLITTPDTAASKPALDLGHENTGGFGS
jgi:hypothetical protein